MQQAWNTNVVSQSVLKSVQRYAKRRSQTKASSQENVSNSSSKEVMQQISDAALAPLGPEFERRVTAQGKQKAVAWLVSAAKDLGHQAGRLMPEYQKKVKSDGENSANNWYIEQAGIIGRQYVANK